nr:MAG TPA: hypothetical protein [Caudoviricetes sp.]
MSSASKPVTSSTLPSESRKTDGKPAQASSGKRNEKASLPLYLPR